MLILFIDFLHRVQICQGFQIVTVRDGRNKEKEKERGLLSFID